MRIGRRRAICTSFTASPWAKQVDVFVVVMEGDFIGWLGGDAATVCAVNRADCDPMHAGCDMPLNRNAYAASVIDAKRRGDGLAVDFHKDFVVRDDIGELQSDA